MSAPHNASSMYPSSPLPCARLLFIRAAYDIIDHWYYKQSELLRSEPVMGMAYDEFPLFYERESTHKGYRKALLFSVRTPWIFASFWVLLGFWGVYIQVA
ncbi:conserved hypothetical protein [Pseudomonas fluorescens Pf0-1]|uniref:Uncharacterized protein n=1 Tax=Pseudomonas fluorescens (strain Pf0-1) TaxID=205922 RepID=Q3KDK8_PSEPF|nr:conserved hypothetical protein [Pseudomonas fluorescens Pf0-1]